MAQARLGQTIRNTIVEAQPDHLAAEIYPPVAGPPPETPVERPATAREAEPRSGRGRPRWAPWRPRTPAKTDLQLEAMRASVAKLVTTSQSLRDEIRGFKDALDLIRRDMSHIQSLSAELEAVRGLFWARFDELEIKVRPLIAFDEESYAVRLMDGYAMVPRAEPMFTVMVANAGSGGLEPGTRQVLKALIEPGMVVADIGANVGLLTLSCAVATGPTGRVHAFEPESGPRSQLSKTLKLNGLHWVDVHDCAVGARSGRALFHISPVIGHSSLHRLPEAEVASGRDETISVMALDDVLPHGARLDVVKIDVEGAELDVLAGMTRLLEDNPDIALVAEFGPSHLARIGIAPDAWFAAFAARGFESWSIEEPWGVCRPVRPRDVADVEWLNLAFVRPDGAARARLPVGPSA